MSAFGPVKKFFDLDEEFLRINSLMHACVLMGNH